jgi:hypothetical protein
VRHEGGKGRFKQREQAQRRGSPRGRVGGGTAANFYGEATAPGARVAPRDRGEGSGGNRCSGVDEREMGQKMEWSGSRRLFKRLDGVGQRGKKGRRGPVGTATWKRREEGGGLWRGGRQRGAADNGPWPSGAGDSVATRTGKGAGTSDTVRAADAQARVRWGTRCQRQGAEERERGRERSGDDRVPTGRPGQHSAGAAIQTVF